MLYDIGVCVSLHYDEIQHQKLSQHWASTVVSLVPLSRTEAGYQVLYLGCAGHSSHFYRPEESACSRTVVCQLVRRYCLGLELCIWNFLADWASCSGVASVRKWKCSSTADHLGHQLHRGLISHFVYESVQPCGTVIWKRTTHYSTESTGTSWTLKEDWEFWDTKCSALFCWPLRIGAQFWGGGQPGCRALALCQERSELTVRQLLL